MPSGAPELQTRNLWSSRGKRQDKPERPVGPENKEVPKNKNRKKKTNQKTLKQTKPNSGWGANLKEHPELEQLEQQNK